MATQAKFVTGDLVKLNNEFFNHVHMVVEVYSPSITESQVWQAGEGEVQTSILSGFTYKVVSYDANGGLYFSHLPEHSLEVVHPPKGKIVKVSPFPGLS